MPAKVSFITKLKNLIQEAKMLKFNKDVRIFLLCAIFLAGGEVWGSVDETMEMMFKEPTIILYGNNRSYANSVKLYYANYDIDFNLHKADSISDSLIQKYNIIAIGTRNSNRFIDLCLKKIPISFTDSSITIRNKTFKGRDIRLVFTIPNPLNPEKRCVIFTAQNSNLIPGITFHPYEKWDFAAYRRSDGIMSEEDNIFVGNFNKKTLAVDTLVVYRENPIKFHKLEDRKISLFYTTLSRKNAKKLLRLLHTMYSAITDQFKISLPEKIYVYVSKRPHNKFAYTGYTDGYNTIWQKKITTEKEFFSPDSKMIIVFAHEFARLAFQPYIHNQSKQGPLRAGSDDWCHYCQFTKVIPYVWDKLGEDAWPIRYNYNKEWGESKFNKIYKGAKDTYAYLLYKIDKKFGTETIGKVLNEVTENGINRVGVDIGLFMEKLGDATGDTSIIREIKDAFPTPLEHSFRRKMEPLGVVPNLTVDFWNNEFKIASIVPDSPADSLGIKPGDIIMKVNGYDVYTHKALAYRSILQEIQDNGWLVFEIKRNEKSIIYKMKIKKR